MRAKVAKFIERRGLSALVTAAAGCAAAHFSVRRLSLELSRDPEEDAEWVVLLVAAAGTPHDLFRAYQRCVRDWVQKSPPDERHLVRFDLVAADHPNHPDTP